MVKRLGVASFIHVLINHKKELRLDDRFLVVVIFGSGDQSFLLDTKQGRSLDCGLIQTDEDTLKKVFNTKNIDSILEQCEKTEDHGLHCPVKNSDKKGDIKPTVDGKEFNCRL